MSTRPSTKLSVAKSVHAGTRDLTLRLIVSLFVAAGMLATFAVTARGQAAQVEAIPMHEAFAQEKIVTRMERAASALVGYRGDLKDFTEMKFAEVYFASYIPSKITQPDSVGEISSLVQKAMAFLSRAQRSNTPGKDKILPWVYLGMKNVAEGNYQTVARINATLVLGRLDERPADNIAQRPPVPLRYSLPILIKLYQDETNSDGIRAAALQGLRRYVSYSLNLTPDDRNTLTTLMTDLLAAQAPENRSADAHAYLQRFAVDILSALGKSKDPQFGSQLISISKQSERPDLIALYSAATVGSMKEGLQGQVDAPDDLLASWSVRALRAYQHELDRLNAMTRPEPARQPPKPDSFLQTTRTAGNMDRGEGMEGSGNMMGGAIDTEMGDETDYEDMAEMMGGMMPGMLGMARAAANPQPPEVFASRRKLNHVLQQLHFGVTGSPEKGLPKQPGGLMAAADEDQKKVLSEWVTSLDEVVSALNDDSLDTRKKFAEALAAQIKMLSDIAGADAVGAANQALAEKGLPIPGAEALAEEEAADPAAGNGLVVPGLDSEDELGAPAALSAFDELSAPE